MNQPQTIVTEEYRRLPLSVLRESKTNPRRHFDKAADADMVASIKAQGVVEPIIVRPLEGGAYEIVAGARRFRCSRTANQADIPAIVRNYTDDQALEVQIIENLQRKDVHPYDEAFGFKQLLEQKDDKGRARYDVPGVAAKVGKSTSYVYMRLKLTDLTPAAQKAFVDDVITAGHAEKIARLTAADQREALAYCRGYNKPSVRELARWIGDNIHLDLHSAAFPKASADLVPNAGPCTTCLKRTGSQPDLFPDVKKSDTCTDRACFHAKLAAFLEVRKAEIAKENGTPPVFVSQNYQPGGGDGAPKGTLGSGAYNEIGKSKPCADTRTALRTDGTRAGRTTTVCTNPKCRLHNGGFVYGNTGGSAAEAKRRKIEARRQKTDAEARRRAIAAFLAAKAANVTTADWRLIGHALIWEMWHDCLKDIALAVSPDAKGEPRATLDTAVNAREGAPLIRLVLTLATFGALATEFSRHKALHTAALKRHRVDPAVLRRQVLAEAAARQKAAAKQKPLQTSAKGKAAKKANVANGRAAARKPKAKR